MRGAIADFVDYQALNIEPQMPTYCRANPYWFALKSIGRHSPLKSTILFDPRRYEPGSSLPCWTSKSQRPRPLRKCQQRWVRAYYASIIRRKIVRFYIRASQRTKQNKRNNIVDKTIGKLFSDTGRWLQKHKIADKLDEDE